MTGQKSDKKIIGLTGGIGSGKSMVARLFRMMHFPVFNSDTTAHDCYFIPEVRKKIENMVGSTAYQGEHLNKDFIRAKIFQDTSLKKKLEEIIHPCVQKKFEAFLALHNTKWIIKESALLFETGIYKNCRFNIVVVSPEELRIRRVKERDNLPEEDILKIMRTQWTDKEKIDHTDAIIFNDEKHSLILQVEEIAGKIKKLD
jgi:dephospho-CoA kinase